MSFQGRIFLFVSIALLVYKTGRLVRQSVWTWRQGGNYVRERLALRRKGEENYNTVTALVKRLGGSSPLSIAGGQTSTGHNPRARALVLVSKSWRALTSLPILITGSVLIVLSVGPRAHQDRAEVLPSLCAYLLVLCMFAASAAAFITTLVLGDFATGHQGFPGLHPPPEKVALSRMAAFAGYLLFSLLASGAAVASMSSYSPNFEHLPPLGSFTSRTLSVRYSESLYFVFLATLGVREIDAYTGNLRY